MIAVLDFGFMGGSMGSVVGEKVALAFEVSAKNDYPFIALVSGGGVRIQEGVLSLMQMAKTVTAANRLLENRIPFIVVLTNPSTGHAYASFANLADLILAEPGSLIGLAPMKTLKEASRKPIPLDAHTAEAHLNHGLLDSVVDREELRERLGVILDVLNNNRNGSDNRKNDDHKNGNRGQAKKQHLPDPDSSTGAEGPLAITKRLGRPTSLEYIRSVVDNFIELRGDRVSGDDRTVVGGLGYLMGERAVIIGQERQAHDDKGIFHTYPEGLRKARRLIELAARFGLPVVTLIDTQGVHPGLESEEQGVGNAIATTMSLMAQVNTPTVAVTIGEGGSEGALALGIADRVLMQQYAVYTPIPPGQSVSRLYRSASKQKGDAQDITLTAENCLELGIIDEIVPEPDGGAHVNPTEAARSLQAAIVKHLSQLNKASSKKLLRDRYKKFRNMGEYTKHSKAAMRREVSLLQHIVLKDPKGQRSKGDQGEQASEDEE
jgi:acetyl-CoA carboxylase carboxyl transferase subunit beta